MLRGNLQAALLLSVACVFLYCPLALADSDADRTSYAKDVLPILQANCHGCHQPAKSEGGYCMTSYPRLLAGGDAGEPAIQPGDPAESLLLEMITPVDGEAHMPLDKPPLTDVEIDLITSWIEQGAQNDLPSGRRSPDADNPPVYRSRPVVTSLDISPDGKLLAVAGYHEVLLCDLATQETIARLIGLSKRIESIVFSPDGKQLAVTGGTPAVGGEVQIWDVADRQLLLSHPVSYDSVYGASWSPDGKLVAFGCADNSVRVIEVSSGDQVLFQASHNDWVLDTAFSVDGSHLVSVSRDQSAKLILVAEERFIDNITSITPGALKGGISAVDRHPDRDEVLIGGADGTPQILRMHRIAERRIGDNANLIRRFPSVAGRIFAAAYSPDGQMVAVASSLDGDGKVDIYSAQYYTPLNDELKKIMGKPIAERTVEERQQVEAYQTADVARIATVNCEAPMYALAFSSGQIFAAGNGGTVKCIDPTTGKIDREFMPFPLLNADDSDSVGPQPQLPSTAVRLDRKNANEEVAREARFVRLRIDPPSISIGHEFDYVQCIVTAETESGQRVDVTRQVDWELPEFLGTSLPGALTPLESGAGRVRCSLGPLAAVADVRVAWDQDLVVDYVRDVAPVVSRLGCNAGTCHGSKKGKNGFKLSLRGYDPVYDVRAFTDDLSSRRVNLAAPEESLMLMKATGGVPHTGGRLTQPGQRYYETLRRWIAGGAHLNRGTSRVQSIQLFPKDATIYTPGTRQQFRVVATHEDGRQRDVTAEAFITSGNTEVAETNGAGLLTSLRRGEASVLARYEGAYDATLLTVMGDRTGFTWSQHPESNFIDGLVYQKLKRIKALPSELCTDSEFLRRASLDLTGLPPTADDVIAFSRDQTETGTKRNALIDRLIGSEAFIEHWTNKWADLLQVNRKFLGVEGSAGFRQWIRDHVAANTPYDEFVHQILTASGSNHEQPHAGYFKTLRTPQDTMENTTHLFLAIRFNCNKCHDHPFERWTQDQYYETAAYFARITLARDQASGDKTVDNAAVDGPKPLYEIVSEAAEGEVQHERTGEDVVPQFPFECNFTCDSKLRREQLAAWITSPDNPYFAKSYANRLWGYLFGVGIIEPIDDIRAGNPPTNPELLDALTRYFIDSGFDIRGMLRTICRSRIYQLSGKTNRWNQDDTTNYSHSLPRRLPAEVLYDTIHVATGAKSRLPEMAGRRAAELPDAGAKLPSGFLDQLGRPARESACECERVNTLQLGPVMALISGPTVNTAIHDPENAIAKLVEVVADDDVIIRQLYLRFLNRAPSDAEVVRGREAFAAVAPEHEFLMEELAAAETEFAPRIAQLNDDRETAIKAAQAAVDAYHPEAARRLATLTKQREDHIAAAKKKLEEYQQSWLTGSLSSFEKETAALAQWTPLNFDQMTSENECELEQLEDASVRASGKNGKTVYCLKARTAPRRLTGIRLEVVPDASLPNNGPGRNGSGNFVLNEFRVATVSNYDRSHETPIPLKNAQADFSQPEYDIADVIDGKVEPDLDGWAVANGYGQVHFAVFEFDGAIQIDESEHLQIEMEQRYQDATHSIGRFRVLVTEERQPLALDGVHQNVASAIARHPDRRSPDDVELITSFARSRDETWTKLAADVRRREDTPVPPDEKLNSLENTLAAAQRPIRIPPLLVRLRTAVELSKQHAQQPRLVAAQDLAWALINSPAFLFNH